MDSKINQSQLTDLFAQASGMSKSASEQFVKSFFDIISEKVLSEGLVKVKGFGTFKLLQIEDRESVNVNTGERFTIEGHQKITFTPDAELKESVNRPFASFETVEITEEQEKVLEELDQTPVVVGDDEEDVEGPQVRDITPEPRKRILRTILLWLLCIVLIGYLVWILLWPVIGNGIIACLDKPQTEKVSITAIDRDSVSAARLQAEQELEIESVGQTVQTETVEPEKSVEPVPAVQPETKPAAAEQEKVITQSFLMDEEDMMRDLSTFTVADTVKYRIAGCLTTHVMKSGETLTKLSLRYYGTKKLWPYIAAYNGITDFGHIDPSAVIRIPKIAYRGNGK